MVDEQRPTTQEEAATEHVEGPPSEAEANGHAPLNGEDPIDGNGGGDGATDGVPYESDPEEWEVKGAEEDAAGLDAEGVDAEGLDAEGLDAGGVPDEAPAEAMEPAEEPAEVALVVSQTSVVPTAAEPEAPVGTPSDGAEAEGENAGLVATLPEATLPTKRYFQEEPAWLPPEFEAQQERAVSPPLGRSPGRLPAAVLALLMAGVFLVFVLIEPTPMWLALFGAMVAAIGGDGVLRSIRPDVFDTEAAEGEDTVPHLFLPVLFALTVPVFIEETLSSYWVIPAALVAACAFIILVLAEIPVEDEAEDDFRGRAHFVSIVGVYFVTFALFSLTYAFDLGLREALIAIALGSTLLSVELLLEGEVDPIETLLLACVIGFVVAQARWVMQYMPLDGYPAALALLLTFYFVTGMVHAYMTRHINMTVTAEYGVVTAVGLVLVIAVRVTGIA